MDPKKSAKLDRLLLTARLKRLALPVLVGLFLAVAVSGLFYSRAIPDPPLKVSEVEGVVISWTRQQTELGSSSRLVMVVKLDDNQDVIVQHRTARSLSVGKRVRLEKVITKSGYIRYRWKL